MQLLQDNFEVINERSFTMVWMVLERMVTN